MKKIKKFLPALFGISVISLLFLRSQYIKNYLSENIKNVEKEKIESCTRTTRLDNKPYFDRALSLIEEKYKVWEEDGESNYGSYYFFPSQLTNCIKVIEEDEDEISDTEGYFIFDDKDIKENYFPIHVNQNYRKSDDIINAILLVHEITHVEQYIIEKNGNDALSCIDKEVDAFYASWNFYKRQYDENRKSVDFRLEHDEDLHSQLQIINVIKNQFSSSPIRGLSGENGLCNGSGAEGDSCIDRIRNDHTSKIKYLVTQNKYYQKQCDL